MEAKELRGKSVDELKQELSSLLKAHFGLRMQQRQRIRNSLGRDAAQMVRHDVRVLVLAHDEVAPLGDRQVVAVVELIQAGRFEEQL